MKAPVGLLSDRTVLRQQDGGASPRQVPICQTKPSIPHSPMKEQADIAPKAGYHRHEDTLPLVIIVRVRRSDWCRLERCSGSGIFLGRHS